jgi:Tetratricopeptide repeat
VWEPLKRMTGRWFKPAPMLFRPAEEELHDLLRENGDQPEPAPESSYLAYIQRRAAHEGVSIDVVLSRDQEEASLDDEEVHSHKECFDDGEVERYVFSAAAPARWEPLPAGRLAHLEGCVLCQTRTAMARPRDPRQVKEMADRMARVDVTEWETEPRPVQLRPVPTIAAAALPCPVPAFAAAARASKGMSRSGRDLVAALAGMGLLALGLQIWGGARPSYTGGNADVELAYPLDGSTPEAKDFIGQALQTNPNNSSLYQLQGSLYATQNEYEKALADYDKALLADPDDASAYKARAEVFGRTKQWEKALDDSNQYLKRKPDDPEGYWVRGQAYEQLGKIDAALKDYQKAVHAANSDKVDMGVTTGAPNISVAPASGTPEKQASTPP